ncbi:MAG: hypothetical protein U5L07_17155 [Desulfobacterales bacterium]|nr:hypothetical protein [Desulfobacterales bacterium]
MSTKAPTEKKRQWLWFAGLWCAGLAACLILAYAVRLILRMAS